MKVDKRVHFTRAKLFQDPNSKISLLKVAFSAALYFEKILLFKSIFSQTLNFPPKIMPESPPPPSLEYEFRINCSKCLADFAENQITYDNNAKLDATKTVVNVRKYRMVLHTLFFAQSESNEVKNSYKFGFLKFFLAIVFFGVKGRLL